jgi:hypothetical protein
VLRVPREERRHARRDRVAAEGDRRVDADHARRAAAGARDRVAGLAQLLEDAHAPLVEGAAVVGEAQRAGGAREQRRAELGLELGDPPADRRRRDPEAAGGGREAAGVDGRGEELDPGQGVHDSCGSSTSDVPPGHLVALRARMQPAGMPSHTPSKAWFVAGRFGVDALTLGERPTPAPGPRQVLVRVRAAALNYPSAGSPASRRRP